MDIEEQEFDNRIDQTLPTESEIEAQAMVRSKWTLGVYKIAKAEDAKFWLMATIAFFICYVYSIMRELKDTFVIVKQTPASIHILKLFYVPPVAIIGTMIVQKMLISSDNKTILKKFLLLFFGLYAGFGIISLPFIGNVDIDASFIVDSMADGKMKFKGTESIVAAIYTLCSWSSTVMFIAAEVFGSLVLSLLFLSVANDVCPLKQFLRFIPLIFVMTNIALIFSGISLYGIKILLMKLSYTNGKIVFSALFFLLSLFCVMTWAFLVFFDKTVLSKPIFIVEGVKKKKKKESIPFMDGIKLMFSSKLVLGICITVLFYNLSQNMADSSYKSLLKIQTSRKGVSASYLLEKQCISQLITGSIVIFLLLTPFSRIVQSAGWIISGSITPLYIGGVSVIVFILALYNTGVTGTNGIEFINTFFQERRFLHNLKGSQDIYALFDTEEFIGKLFVSGGFKVMKYASFDICKEAISMKIDPKYRSRFKGVYDGICGKLGKSMGAIISLFITIFFNTQDVRQASLIYLVLVVILLIIWMIVIFYLGKKYEESVDRNTYIDIDVIKGKKDVQKE